MPKEFPRLIIALTVTALVVGFLVAVVERITREPIATAEARAFTKALRSILPPDSPAPQPVVITLDDGTTNTVYIAGKAIAIEIATPNGYGGEIDILLGFDKDDTLYGYSVIRQHETPGLGDKIKSPHFANTLLKRNAFATDWRVTKDGGDIDAITAATVSSRAVLDAIRSALPLLRTTRINVAEPM